ncbi:hypothetical protein ACFO0S_05835 [Chryseomicrobium palamuruense]|uniref:DUF5590 domain-containing protein n=1 Tax=Chryseomicrobium palamuruense TaxID=682973 RepID=A0ABV8UVL0_9BACL
MISILIIGAVSIFSGIGILYTLAKNPQDAEFEKVTKLVQDQQLIQEIESVYSYNSVKSYITVIGKTSEEEHVAYLVDKENYQSAFEVKLSTGVTKEHAEELVSQNQAVKEILYTKLGYEEVGPVWEVTYVNAEDALSYTYVNFITGDWWKRISNL